VASFIGFCLGREMCIRFADLERKLGEIDRARALYAYCSQICDPRVCVYLNIMALTFYRSYFISIERLEKFISFPFFLFRIE